MPHAEPKDTHKVLLRLPIPLWEELGRWAEEEMIPVSIMARHLIHRAVQDHRRQPR